MAWKIWKRLMCTKTASKSSPSKNFKRAWCDMVRPWSLFPAQNGFLMAFWCFLKWSYDGRYVSWRYHESSQKISGVYSLCVRVPSLAAKRTGSKPERDRKERHGTTVGPCLSFGGFWGHLYQKKNLSANPLQDAKSPQFHIELSTPWDSRGHSEAERSIYQNHMKSWCVILDSKTGNNLLDCYILPGPSWRCWRQSHKLRQNRPPTSSWRLLGWQDLIEETPQCPGDSRRSWTTM